MPQTQVAGFELGFSPDGLPTFPKEVIKRKRRTISCGLASDHGYTDRYLSVGTLSIKRRIFELGKTVRQNISHEIRLPPCSGLGENLF